MPLTDRTGQREPGSGHVDRFAERHREVGIDREIRSAVGREGSRPPQEPHLPAVQGLSGDAVLRGAGALAAKSEALLSVSVQPLARRRAAVALVVPAPAAPSKKFAPSQPTRSMISASCAGEQGVEPPLQPSGGRVDQRHLAARAAHIERAIRYIRRWQSWRQPRPPPLPEQAVLSGSQDAGQCATGVAPKFPAPWRWRTGPTSRSGRRRSCHG